MSIVFVSHLFEKLHYIFNFLTEDLKQIPEVQRLHFWVGLLSSICVSPLVLTGFQQGYSEIEKQYCQNHAIHFVLRTVEL
jgi:hypothetical protein